MSLFFCGGDHVHFISAGSFSHVPRLRRRQFRPRKAGSNRRCGWEHRKHRTPNFPADRGFPLFKPFHVVSLQCHQLEKWLGMGFPYHRPKHGFLTGGAFLTTWNWSWDFHVVHGCISWDTAPRFFFSVTNHWVEDVAYNTCWSVAMFAWMHDRCQMECQIECQIERQIEFQIRYQIEFQIKCQIRY